MKGWPVILWKTISADMVRIGVVTLAALLLVTSFAASIRFLAEGRVDLTGTLIVMAFAAVPMMQYSLPFACGLSSTLSYHRLADDNEAVAAMASGVSHRALIAPALLLGVVSAIALALLANTVIPRFLRSVEDYARSDLAGVLVNDVERGRTVRLDRFRLAAREAVRAGPDPAVGAIDRIYLRDVLAARMAGDGTVSGYINAAEVNVWLFQEETPDGDFTAVQLQFVDVEGEMDGERLGTRRFESARVRIPSTFVDEPKFMTLSELLGLREHPERVGRINGLRRDLAMRLAEQDLIDGLRARFATDGRVMLHRPEGERVIITASDLTQIEGEARWRLEPLGGLRSVRVERIPERTSSYVQQAAGAVLEFERAESELPAHEAVAVRLRLEGVTTLDDRGADAALARDRVDIAGLAAGHAAERTDELLASNAERLSLIAASAPSSADLSSDISRAARRLADRIDGLHREAAGRVQERIAYALSSVVTILCGAVVALRRQGGIALGVYLWSFFPALGAVITISSGQKLAERVGAPGLVLLWGGVLVLAVYTALEFNRLRRH